MKKINRLFIKLAVTAVVLLFYYIMMRINAQCIFVSLFGIPCMGCGMTRAWLSALRLDFASAFSYHFMFWAVPVLYLFILYDGRLFKRNIVNKAVLLLIGAGFIVNYIYKLILW